MGCSQPDHGQILANKISDDDWQFSFAHPRRVRAHATNRGTFFVEPVLLFDVLRDHHVFTSFRIGFLVFPNITQLDLTGPYEVLSQLPGAQLHLVWKTLEPVRAGSGLVLQPTRTFADCPQVDLICVPGGGGMNALLTDSETLDFIRRQAGRATDPPGHSSNRAGLLQAGRRHA